MLILRTYICTYTRMYVYMLIHTYLHISDKWVVNGMLDGIFRMQGSSTCDVVVVKSFICCCKDVEVRYHFYGFYQSIAISNFLFNGNNLIGFNSDEIIH